MYRSVTRSIQVTVRPSFVESDSSPSEDRYVWSYTIEILNLGLENVRLRSRCWTITDGRGRIEEVRGIGVVGKEPSLKPGESFEYTSGCPLSTPSGIMVGTYQMQTDDGEMFSVDIPAFSLDLPNAIRVLH
jgi:ApaG protein